MNKLFCEEKSKPPWHSVLKSVLAAFVGIQSEKNRQRDFNSTQPAAFICVGIMMLFGLIAGLMGLVKLGLYLMASN